MRSRFKGLDLIDRVPDELWTEVRNTVQETGISRVRLFATKDGEALYSQQKQDWELTEAQIMNSLLPNSGLN